VQHATPLIATLVAALGFALLFGVLAKLARLPPIVGYLIAGIAVGPHTPGFIADQEIAMELAEIGVILLMFGVGLHFSPRDLTEARGIVVPGALGQMAAATGMGWALGRIIGWDDVASLVFGLALSVASTVVLLRALTERGEVTSETGRVAVGWLVVEDIAMVLALVLLPLVAVAGAGGASVGEAMAWTIGKLVLFVAIMLIVGTRVLPWVLSLVAGLRSRELFSLATLAAALGVAAVAAKLFGVSFALGAFLAGLVLGRSELALKAAEQTLPLRDAFAVLFFVSVGMLFNPAILWERPVELVATVAIVLVGKSVVAYRIARLRGLGPAASASVAASLAQIGEFSFILAGLAVVLGVMPRDAQDLILAAALLSIALNPLAFRAADRFTERRLAPKPAE
jgi:monovalent cation:H+ antiporter-2, CPA2 family